MSLKKVLVSYLAANVIQILFKQNFERKFFLFLLFVIPAKLKKKFLYFEKLFNVFFGSSYFFSKDRGTLRRMTLRKKIAKHHFV
jgi:hypothetical protein